MPPENLPEPERAAEAQPQLQPQSQPETETDASPSRGAFDGRGRAEAYIPLPQAPAPPKKSRWLAALAAAALLALGAAGALHRKATAPPVAPPAAAVSQKAFMIAPQDRDAEATALAQRILARDAQTHELAALNRKLREERAAAPAAGAPAGPQSAKERQVAEALAAVPQGVRQSIVDGSAGFYTFRFIELKDEGGDVFDVSVDGVPVARVVTSRQLSTLTIPLDPKVAHTITETLVFARDRRVYVKDGPAGSPQQPSNQASLGIASSAGEMRGRTMSAGENENWTVQMGGGAGTMGSGQ